MVLCAALGIAHVTGLVDDVAERLAAIPWRVAIPGPRAWMVAAKPGDLFVVPGYPVAYWGKPDAIYGKRATDQAVTPIAIVVHHTAGTNLYQLVRYGHSTDEGRGGSYGYHIYISRDGRIVQGAPLTRRTNHVKPPGSPQRKPFGNNVSNINSIGVSMVGACVLKPNGAATEACEREDVTAEQMEAGMSVVAALQARFKIKCAMVFGHGELQTDREAFEGELLAKLMRGRCLL